MTSLRIGLLVPSSNTVMEPDLQGAFLGMATVHAARMYLPDPYTVEDELRMIDDHVEAASRDIATTEPDLIVFGCTSAAALRGPGYDQDLCKRLALKTRRPIVSILDTITKCLRRCDVVNIGVVTPYPDQLNAAIRRTLVQDGFSISCIAGMGLRKNADVGRIKPAEIVDFVTSNTPTDVEAVAVPCTNLRAYEVRHEIAEALGKPVVTANSSVIDDVRQRLWPGSEPALKPN